MALRRSELKNRLKRETFDLLIVGGGSVGSGIALDAVLRGYNVALIEGGDFASGTSSKSTKLLHGGVRYLESAFWDCDLRQLFLVREALDERKKLLTIAPQLAHPLAIIIPTSGLWQKLYYGLGIKLYDLMAGKKGIGKANFLSKEQLHKILPPIRKGRYSGGVLFYDGQFNDSRMNLAIILKAIDHGAVALNYVEWRDFIKRKNKITGVVARDLIDGEEYSLSAKLIVNATGAFADSLRLADNPAEMPMIKGSSGIHILLEGNFTPQGTGMLIPKTEDGRILFLLPWQGKTLVGTTDQPTEIRRDIEPDEKDIKYLIDHINGYLEKKISQNDLIASWCGIRPLVRSSSNSTTKKLSRDYAIEISESGLYSVMGGKWTLYRKMAEELLNLATAKGALPSKGKCITATTALVGIGHPESLPLDLPSDIRNHLIESYGDKASEVIEIAKKGFFDRLAKGYPYIEAEVLYAIENELATKVEDVLYRRLQLGFIDDTASKQAFSSIKKYFI